MTDIQILMARASLEAHLAAAEKRLEVLSEPRLAGLDPILANAVAEVKKSRAALALHYLTVEKRQLNHEFPIRIVPLPRVVF